MKEQSYDILFNIKTIKEQKGFNNSFHYYRYEPTPYAALEEFFQNYQVNSNDRIVDFGCGKGRLNFFIHYFFGASVVGVEMNQEFYQEALENRKNYQKKIGNNDSEIIFYCGLAEEYRIDPRENKFYFFNPFSVKIFMKIVDNILYSYEVAPRDIEIILYYSSDDYVYYLEQHPMFTFVREIKLSGIYQHNMYERFLIFRLGNYW